MGFLPNLGLFFFYIQSVLSQPFFTTFEPIDPPFIEWDQINTSYYTGQTIQMNWTSQGFLSSDVARIQYTGAGGTRTLTSGSGTLIQTGTYSIRLSDSSNGVATNVPVTIAHLTNTTNALQSTTRISVIQSKLMNIIPLDGNRTLGGGQNTVCDDRNLTVVWRGLGEAQFGTATVSLSKLSGSSGTLGTTQTNIPVSGNMSVNILCPRASTPSTFSQYAFQISVTESGGAAYTGTSTSFSVAAAPTPTPSNTPTSTPSQTPTPSSTPSKTPTPSPSISKTPTPTPSYTPSQTPSVSPSITPSPSTTETARASIDYVAIGKAAASQVDTTTPAIAGALGSIGSLILLLGIVKWYQTKQMTERRRQRVGMTSRFVQEANSLYGIRSQQYDDPVVVNHNQPTVVMYTVANMPQRGSGTESIKKGFAPKSITK